MKPPRRAAERWDSSTENLTIGNMVLLIYATAVWLVVEPPASLGLIFIGMTGSATLHERYRPLRLLREAVTGWLALRQAY